MPLIRKIGSDPHLAPERNPLGNTTLFKRRNVEAHLADEHHEELRQRLNAAYHETNATQAVTLLRATVKWLRRISPAAAASLEEGLEETLAVVRLGVPELLRKTRSPRPTQSRVRSAWPRA
jgi:hypothetical protein